VENLLVSEPKVIDCDLKITAGDIFLGQELLIIVECNEQILSDG